MNSLLNPLRIAAIVVLSTVLAPTASAHDGHLTGTWRVLKVVTTETEISFPEALESEGTELVFGRWLWRFSDTRLKMTTQVLDKTPDENTSKGTKTIRETDFSWCSNQITVDIGWNRGTLMLPKAIQSETKIGRYDKAGKPVNIDGCNVMLNDVQSLTPIKGAQGAPPEAMTLVTPSGHLKFIITPDETTVDVESQIR